MNPSEHRLERLLNVAKKAGKSLPEPSPWFEQRLMAKLKTEQAPLAQVDTGFILRFLTTAALFPVLALILLYVNSDNPYVEAVEWTSPTSQIENTN